MNSTKFINEKIKQLESVIMMTKHISIQLQREGIIDGDRMNMLKERKLLLIISGKLESLNILIKKHVQIDTLLLITKSFSNRSKRLEIYNGSISNKKFRLTMGEYEKIEQLFEGDCNA